jgi:hypothetical protein
MLTAVSMAFSHGPTAQEKQLLGKWWVRGDDGKKDPENGDYLVISADHKYKLVSTDKGEWSRDESGTWSIDPKVQKWPGYQLKFMFKTTSRGSDGKMGTVTYGFTGKALINEADAGYSFVKAK